MAIFYGRTEWCTFKTQFDRIADRYRWSEDQNLELFIKPFRYKALKFYCTCAKPVQYNYKDLCKKFKSRFGQKELPLTVRRNIQDIKQDNKSVEEFAE